MTGGDVSEYEELFRGVTIKVGLRQQGHIPTVQFMLSQGATDENSFFTEGGRLLDAGCYMTVFDEHFDERATSERANL